MLDFKENPFVTMRIRNHCGSLVDALKTEQSIPRTVYSLLAVLNEDLKEWVNFTITEAHLSLGPVCYDERIGWHSRLIIIDGWGPWGHLDDSPDVPEFDLDRYTAIIAIDALGLVESATLACAKQNTFSIKTKGTENV